MSSEGTPAPAGTVTPPAGGTANWFEGADAETVGYFQNRGWDKMTPANAALEASKAHRAAEKLIGAPANELLRMPKDAADAEGWQRFNDRIGVPKEAKEYDFSGVKFKDGSDLDAPFIEAITPALQKAHVAKGDAAEVIKAVVQFMDQAEGSTVAEQDAALQAERQALSMKWGANAPTNLLIAKQTVNALGVTPEQVAALEKVVGYSKVMDMMHTIGVRIGEDKFVTNNAPGGNGALSADQATAALAEKQADSGWVAKLMAGDAATLKEFDQLTQIKSGKIR